MQRVLVVCFANYCRSPVAEKILTNIFGGEIKFSSAGLQPKIDVCMDPRSVNFLKAQDIQDHEHFPRKIDQKKINESNLILCMDHLILNLMNKNYPKSAKKLRLFTFKEPQKKIEDPYKLDEQRYEEVMKKIELTCDLFNYEDFAITENY